MKRVLLALPLALLAACSSDKPVADKDVLMTCDFDTLVGWVPDHYVFTEEKAHSGKYCIKVGPNFDFSMGYNRLMGQLSATRVRGVKLDFWVFATDANSKGKFEFVLKDAVGGKEVFRQQVHLEQAPSFGKWVPMSEKIIFPPATNYSSQLVMYLSKAEATTPAYVDDIKLTALR